MKPINKKLLQSVHITTDLRWAIRQEALEKLISFVEDSEKRIDAAMLSQIVQVENKNGFDVLEGGVAVIPIVGPITRYWNCFSASIEDVQTAFAMAMDDPSVKSIILDVNSPGGTVDGTAEMAQIIREARGKKPIVTYAGGTLASGAYWLGSAADKIVLGETAVAGSIGVVAVIEDNRRAQQAKGIDRYQFVSSASPNKRLDPATEEGATAILEEVNALAGIFIDAVAKNRNTSVNNVLENFGKGGVFIGAEAVKRGMADEVGTFESVYRSLAKPSSNIFTGGAGAKASMTREEIEANHPEIVSAIRSEANAQGAEAERKRIQEIEAVARPGHEELVKAMKFDGKSTSGDVAVAILKADDEKSKNAYKGRTDDAKDIPTVDNNHNPEGEDQAKAEDALADKIAGFANAHIKAGR